MRWFVDISSVGKGGEKHRYCVESDSWQRALQAARALRDDPGPMTGFSIELLDDGFSAVDPVKRLRYAIRKAPADEPLTDGKKGSQPPPSVKAVAPSPPVATSTEASARSSAIPPAVSDSIPPPSVPSPPSAPRPASRPPAPDLKLSPRKNKTPIPPRPSETPQVPVPAPVAELSPPLEIIAQRDQEPGPTGPLTYRERAFYLAGDTSKADAEKLLRQELERVRRAISTARAGKLVNLALFNVRFVGRPTKLPLATLTWKDWRDEPLITFPEPRAPANAAAPAPQAPQPVVPQVVAPQVVAPQAVVPTATVRMSIDEVPLPEGPVPPVATASDLAGTPLKPATTSVPGAGPPSAPRSLAQTLIGTGESIVPLKPVPPADDAPPRTERAPTSARAPIQKRLRGDELIADLFEAMHDLQFLRDSIEGAEFCLTLALEKMPAKGGIVHLYDINRREFVVTCAGGSGGETLLSQRSAETDAILAAAMRKRRPLVLADATTDEAARTSPRYIALGGAKSLLVAPVAVGGRFLGAIELLNPSDNTPFTGDDGHALSYIAEQLAAFISQRGLLLEREKSTPPPPVKTGRSATAR